MANLFYNLLASSCTTDFEGAPHFGPRYRFSVLLRPPTRRNWRRDCANAKPLLSTCESGAFSRVVVLNAQRNVLGEPYVRILELGLDYVHAAVRRKIHVEVGRKRLGDQKAIQT